MVAIVVGTNSFVTRAEANTFLAESYAYAAAWAALDGSARDRALIEAFYLLDRQLYKGTRTGGSAQVAQFPRNGITSCDGFDESGTVPVSIKRAQMLLAAAIVVDSSVATSDGAASNIRRAQAGSASVEFFRAGTASGGKGTRFPTPVAESLKCYLLVGGGGNSRSNGTGEDIECPDFGLSRGF